MSKVFFLKFIIFANLLLSHQVKAQNPEPGFGDLSSNNSQRILIVKVDPQKSLPITITSRNATVSEITTELTRQIKIPFALSRVVKNYKPALKLSPSTLEKVLPRLAPFALLENELSGQSRKPQIKGIYLFGYNEPIPRMPGGAEISNEQTFIFEGNTETNFDHFAAPDSPLKVTYNGNKLSVSARNQLVIIVAGKIAEQLGIPLSVTNNPKKFVSLDFKDLSLEQAFRKLPSNIVLKYRSSIDGSQPILTEMVLR